MSTYRQLRSKWIDTFEKAGFENIDFELNELLGLALGVDCRSAVFVDKLNEQADEEAVAKLDKLCERRMNGEPLQYILGEWEFYGLPFKVGKGVLIPRQDTELIVDIAVSKLKDRQDITVIDLCAGSGCIGVALDKNLSCKQTVCIEKSPEAYGYLEQNVRLNDSSVQSMLGDVLDEQLIADLPAADLIVSNPPYVTGEDMRDLQREVTYEPETALFGGEDGLDFYRDITRLWKSKLNEGGMLLFEIGCGQEDDVMKIMIQHGFKNVRTRADLCGVNRCVFGFVNNSPKLCTDVMSI